MQFADVLLTREDVDAKADALIDFIRETVVGHRFSDDRAAALLRGRVLCATGRVVPRTSSAPWRAATGRAGARTTWRPSGRSGIGYRTSLSAAPDWSPARALASDLPWGEFADRTVYVIDVANLEQDAQDLIFARVVSKLRKHLEQRDLGVDHVIVFVDELE